MRYKIITMPLLAAIYLLGCGSSSESIDKRSKNEKPATTLAPGGEGDDGEPPVSPDEFTFLDDLEHPSNEGFADYYKLGKCYNSDNEIRVSSRYVSIDGARVNEIYMNQALTVHNYQVPGLSPGQGHCDSDDFYNHDYAYVFINTKELSASKTWTVYTQVYENGVVVEKIARNLSLVASKNSYPDPKWVDELHPYETQFCEVRPGGYSNYLCEDLLSYSLDSIKEQGGEAIYAYQKYNKNGFKEPLIALSFEFSSEDSKSGTYRLDTTSPLGSTGIFELRFGHLALKSDEGKTFYFYHLPTYDRGQRGFWGVLDGIAYYFQTKG